MADGINRVFLLGRLAADGELRFTQTGTPVLNFRLATNESYKDRNDVRQERVEWHTCVLWGPRGEALAPHMTKGKMVHVEGSLRTSSYEKDGEKRYKTEIHVSNVALCGDRGDRGDDAEGGDEAPPARGARAGGQQRGGGDGPARAAGDFEIKFGNDAGKKISEVRDLSWLREALEKSCKDPEKAKWRANNLSQIKAIDEEMARRKGGAVVAAGKVAPADDFGAGQYSDDDIPF